MTQFEYAGETDDVETLIYIGLCHQSLGDTTKSYEAFSKALANGGENAEVYYQMGMCMFSTGDYDKALSHLQNGLALGGGQHKQEMMYTLGLCHERQLDYKAALKAFEDYVAAIVTHGGVIMALLEMFGLPEASMHEWLTPGGCGYTIRVTPSLWSQGRKFEVIAQIPEVEGENDFSEDDFNVEDFLYD